MIKLAKLFAVGSGAFLVILMLLVIRFVLLAKHAQAQTGVGLVAIDAYLLVHSTWLIASFIAVLAVAGWVGYEWIFKH